MQMHRCSEKFIVALAILICAAATSPYGFAEKVLVVSTGEPALDNQLRSLLQNEGHIVTTGKIFSTFSGEGLAGQDVVLLLPNLIGTGDMLPAGQNALVDFVTAGGGLVISEWTVWFSSFHSFTSLTRILPVMSSNLYGERSSITYTMASPDALLNNSPLFFYLCAR
jgi:hypothetical protein